MAKKAIENDVLIYCTFYKGLKSKMPQEAKDRMKVEKPEHYKCVFGETETDHETVQE